MANAAEAIAKMNEEISSGKGPEIRQAGTDPTPTPDPTPDPTPTTTETPVARTPESTPPAQAPATAGKEPDNEIPDEVFSARLSKMTDGRLKSQEDFNGMIKQLTELQDQAKKGFEPKYKSEQAKWAHQLLSNASNGDELQEASRTIRALTFKMEGKDPKDILFEKYLLDPKNSDLSPSQALKYFEAEYEEQFGDMKDNVVKERKHDIAVREAKETIMKFQNEFKAFEEQPRQIGKQVEEGVANSVKGLKELKIKLSSDPKSEDFLTVPVDDPQLLQKLHDDILDPTTAYNELVAQFETEQGFNYNAFRDEMYQRANHKKLRELAYEQGKTAGRLEQVNKNRNASDPKDISKSGASPAAKPNSLTEAWGKAAGVAV